MLFVYLFPFWAAVDARALDSELPDQKERVATRHAVFGGGPDQLEQDTQIDLASDGASSMRLTMRKET